MQPAMKYGGELIQRMMLFRLFQIYLAFRGSNRIEVRIWEFYL
jgi:hypothetical protein